VSRAAEYVVTAVDMPTASAAHAAGGAPQQLFNKTVTMSWTTSSTVTSAGGQTKNVTNANTRTVYISGAGRPFLRMQLTSTRISHGNRDSRGDDRGPEDTARGSVRFEPGKLVGVENLHERCAPVHRNVRQQLFRLPRSP